jgi:hypothetical protein
MAYCNPGDLLIGDMEISSALSRESYIRDAANEMDARLGFVYALPIVGIPTHAQTLLKMINARLASGRLLMSIAAPSEDDSVHRYGTWLIKCAYDDLYAICNGQIVLTGATTVVDSNPNSGSIYNHDEESAFDMFENAIMRGSPSWWQPGSVS